MEGNSKLIRFTHVGLVLTAGFLLKPQEFPFRLSICVNRTRPESHNRASVALNQSGPFVPVPVICIYITKSLPEVVLVNDYANCGITAQTPHMMTHTPHRLWRFNVFGAQIRSGHQQFASAGWAFTPRSSFTQLLYVWRSEWDCSEERIKKKTKALKLIIYQMSCTHHLLIIHSW